ncbi:RNA-binding cell elongation regulator Jag/EloR [Candidatus Poriferisocius sp.]|uniref:RNA-binding cell elongation regulator Jag/EloR n=1 Tax=Candidatus Poriferisocius sp. TaxID=3101276 RepID=UPI003B01A101
MEWLEVTGKTIAQAEEAALDRLGVDRSEAEFSVVDEPKTALLGLRRTEARIRARVRPVLPREKRNRRPSTSKGRNRNRKPERGNVKEGRNRGGRGGQGQDRSSGASSGARSSSEQPKQKSQNASKTSRGAGKNRPSNAPAGDRARKSKTMEDPMSLQEQSTLVVEFLDGLLDAFDLDAEVYAESVADDTMEMRVENAEGVGLLIGPKGNTLRAVEDLSRMLVQRKSDGNCEGRIRVDIGGYRERRRAALESFCEKIALDVRDTGVDRPLEPMNAADRKVVHDVVAEIDGVNTVSEGQEPRRWVVIVPS